jgi:hypothetical protein
MELLIYAGFCIATHLIINHTKLPSEKKGERFGG